MTQWKRERERETSEEERNKTTEKRVYRDARKEVLKVNRIAATESYCRGGKSRRRRHWMRRAEAIYSIHGRANTNLRLDVQTAPSRLFLSPWLFPRLFLHLRPLLLFSPSPPLFPLFSLPPCASPFSILLSFRPSALLPHDRFSSPCHQRTPLVICHSDSQHTIHQATARVPDQRDRACELPPRRDSIDVEPGRELLSDLWRNQRSSRSTCVLPLLLFLLLLLFFSFFLVLSYRVSVLVLRFEATFVTPWRNQSR